MADFGQNRLWPNRLWPNRLRLVFVCVCVCVGFTVSVWGFQGFGLVMFGALGTALPGDRPSLDRPPPDSPSPLPPQNSFFSSLSGCLLVDFRWLTGTLKCARLEFSGCRVNFGPPPFGPPTLRTPTPSGPPFGAVPFGPTLQGPHPSGPQDTTERWSLPTPPSFCHFLG